MLTFTLMLTRQTRRTRVAKESYPPSLVLFCLSAKSRMTRALLFLLSEVEFAMAEIIITKLLL